MKAARILVLGVALAAGGAAAFLVGSDEKKPEAPAPAVQQLPTVDVLIARGDIGMGMGVAVSADNFAWQTEEERDDRGRAEISLSGTA
jgi:pilus assembly protein CpaB